MYVSGIGVSRFGPNDTSFGELIFGTASEALHDAGLAFSDIDAVYLTNNLAPLTDNQCHLSAILAGYLPGRYLPIFNVEAACASGGVAMHQGCLALQNYQRVLVIGVEKMTHVPAFDLLNHVASDGDRLLDQRHGLIFPAAGALVADHYLRKYAIAPEALADVALKNHHNGNRNPKAHFFGKKVDRDKILNSKMIASPLRLFDCSPNSDGAAAVVLEREKRTPRSCRVLATSFVTNHLNFAQEKDLSTRPELQQCAKAAYGQAGVRPEEIDFAELHDGFTIMEWVGMENIGLAATGKAPAKTAAGETALQGKQPINPSGGLKACGHPLAATGVRQIAELVTQLRGEAGERQVPKNQLGLALNIGSLIGSATIHILGNKP